MPCRPFRRCLALALLGLWLAPGAGAVALGLHVADHHDGGHRDGGHHDAGHRDGGRPDHESTLEELVAAAVHGHHHNAAAPHHEHPAHFDAAPGVSAGPSLIAAVPADLRAATDRGHGEPVASRHRRGPPVPLFHAHCALLL